jgi:hypothetical protein
MRVFSQRKASMMTTIELEPSVAIKPARTNNQYSLPSTEQLLTEGGDDRIACDAIAGMNKYGCSPLPDPDMVALGSSTASIISNKGFAAADTLRNRLLLATASESPVSVYTRELHRVRRELTQLCGIADGSGVDVVFAASGTDIHLIAAQACGSAETQSTLVIMADPNETGTGVAAALAGRHFSSHSALGEAVVFGADIARAAPIEVVSVAMRDAIGTARTAAAIDDDFEALTSQAIAQGRRVLLILIDGSKTGAIAPSPACALKLQQKAAGRIDILVDACQFRIAPATLQAYLQHDFMVALTGSKFVTGPTFSGALLIPPMCARRLRRRPLPLALRAYSTRADWPQDWTAASVLDSVPNFGMLLRWEAALRELRAFHALPEAVVANFFTAFNHAVQDKLKHSPLFEALPLPSLERQPLVDANSWDHIPTIHPFLLFRPDAMGVGGRSALNRDQTLRVYQLLQADLSGHGELGFGKSNNHLAGLRCQLGQPVACGLRAGVPVSALRVCASMRLVVQATASEGRNAALVIEKVIATLDKTALLAMSYMQ